MQSRTRILLITSVAVFLSFLDTTVVNIAFPAIRSQFASSGLGTVSLTLSGFNVVFAAALIPAGLLGDRWGRRRMFLGGLLGFVLASAACAAAPDIYALLAARIVQAAAAAALIPSSLALVLPEFPLERRASATALWGATGAIAAAAGPSLGGLLVQYGDWRWVFLINLPLGLAAFAAGVLWLPARRARGKHASIDGLGVALVALAIGGVTLGVTQGGGTAGWGWSDPRTLVAFAVSAAAGVGFVRRSRRQPHPVVDLGLFTSVRFSAAITGSLVFALGFYALLLANVTFLTGVWHYSTIRAGLALSPSPLLAALFGPLTGRFIDRAGSRLAGMTGATIFAVACALFAIRTGNQPDYLRMWLPVSCLAGVGIGMTLAAFSSAAVITLPAAQLGAGSALSQTARQVGAALGVASFIALLGAPSAAAALDAFHRCWWAMAAAAALAAAVGVLLPRTQRRPRNAPDSKSEIDRNMSHRPASA